MIFLSWDMLGVFIVLLFIAAESITVITSWWLTFWSENRDALSPWFYLRIYTGINMVYISILFNTIFLSVYHI